MKRLVLLSLLVSLSFSLPGCNFTSDQVSIPPPGDDMRPEITVTALPIEPTISGDIEKQKVTSTAVSNVDAGLAAQFIVTAVNGAPPKTTGGVQSLSVSISQAGATVFQGTATGVKDTSGKVPNLLSVNKTSSNSPVTVQMNSIAVLTATASNFNGQSNTVSVTYVPVNSADRKKDVNEILTLTKVPGQNDYRGTLPNPAALPVNGFLKSLNGGALATPTILIRKGHLASSCLDPAATITLLPHGNLNPGDFTKLFGSETPEFSIAPIDIRACVNPSGFLPDHLEIRVGYQLK